MSTLSLPYRKLSASYPFTLCPIQVIDEISWQKTEMEGKARLVHFFPELFKGKKKLGEEKRIGNVIWRVGIPLFEQGREKNLMCTDKKKI